jgi:hypothetical protein
MAIHPESAEQDLKWMLMGTSMLAKMTRNPIFLSFAVYTFLSNKAAKRPSFSFSIIQMHLSKRFILRGCAARIYIGVEASGEPFLRRSCPDIRRYLCNILPVFARLIQYSPQCRRSDLFTVIRVTEDGQACDILRRSTAFTQISQEEELLGRS